MMNRIFVKIVIFFVTASLLLVSCDNKPHSSGEPPQKISIAVMPYSFTGYSVFVAKERDFFKDEGLDVSFQSFPHGKVTLNALTEKKADFAVSSETPFVHAVMGGAEISTIAVTIKAHDHLAVVTRKDKGIQSTKDLKGKKIGVTIGSNGEYFLDTVLLLNGLQRSEIESVHLRPGQMFDALMNGEVDGIATWNPQMYKARKELGDQGNIFYAEGLYSPFFLVATRKDYIASNPETVARVIRALNKSSIFISENLHESHRIVAKHLNIKPAILDELSAKYDFSLSLEQSFLITLENQSEWAIKNNLSDRIIPPDYFDYIYLKALETVSPEKVTIIH